MERYLPSKIFLHSPANELGMQIQNKEKGQIISTVDMDSIYNRYYNIGSYCHWLAPCKLTTQVDDLSLNLKVHRGIHVSMWKKDIKKLTVSLEYSQIKLACRTL